MRVVHCKHHHFLFQKLSSWSLFLQNINLTQLISDIDGTITESDVKGHVAAAFGYTAVQKNVVELYEKIYNNGYKVLYLTARYKLALVLLKTMSQTYSEH